MAASEQAEAAAAGGTAEPCMARPWLLEKKTEAATAAGGSGDDSSIDRQRTWLRQLGRQGGGPTEAALAWASASRAYMAEKEK